MPARYYPLVTNYFYHTYNRGVNKQPIFLGSRDYKRFTTLLKFYNYVDHPIRFSKFLLLSNDQRKEIWHRLENSATYTDLIAYCLMPNHYHFLLKQNIDGGIQKIMADLQNSYAKYVNIKNSRCGPLLQGRFKAVKIDSEEQLLHVSRYIHLNPYSSAIVRDYKSLLNYSWSSIKEYVTDEEFEICSKKAVLELFSTKQKYINFLIDNADYQKNIENIKHIIID